MGSGGLIRRVVALVIGMGMAVSAAAVSQTGAHEAIGATPGSVVAAASAEDEVKADAMNLARSLRAIPTRDGDFEDTTRYCPAERMTVLWSKPEGTFAHGAYIEPLGPVPTESTNRVNGVVLCAGSLHAFMGFEAERTATGWTVLPVPDIGGDESDLVEIPPVAKGKKGKKIAGGLRSAKQNSFTEAIEPYAAYDPQSTCSPAAKPGVVAFRDMLLATYPGTRSLGITRSCGTAGVTEHKEGRALDWGVRANNASERATAERVLAWLFATDENGNTHAMARRLGVMYVIWNHHIWGAYRADEGWRAYHGSSPHTDHVHFSFAWPGARKETSFWSGKVVDMPAAAPGGAGVQLVAARSGGGSSVRKTTTTTTTTRHRTRQRTRRTITAAQRREWERRMAEWRDKQREQRREMTREQIEAWLKEHGYGEHRDSTTEYRAPTYQRGETTQRKSRHRSRDGNHRRHRRHRHR